MLKGVLNFFFLNLASFICTAGGYRKVPIRSGNFFHGVISVFVRKILSMLKFWLRDGMVGHLYLNYSTSVLESEIPKCIGGVCQFCGEVLGNPPSRRRLARIEGGMLRLWQWIPAKNMRE